MQLQIPFSRFSPAADGSHGQRLLAGSARGTELQRGGVYQPLRVGVSFKACAGLVARENGRDHDLSLVVIVHLSSERAAALQGISDPGLEAPLCEADVSSPVRTSLLMIPESPKDAYDMSPAWWSPNMSNRPPSCICIWARAG